MERKTILDNIRNDITEFQNKFEKFIVIIGGATATGKTAFSIDLASFFDIEIVSSDSRQIYKYMNIGTDKVSIDIRKEITHHQIDILDPDENYTAGQRKQDSEKIIETIFQRGNIPFIVGGTGLYIDTIYKNFYLPEISPDYEFRKELEELEYQKTGTLYQRLKNIDPQEAKIIHPQNTRYIIRALEIYEKTGTPKSMAVKQQDLIYPILFITLLREKGDTNDKIDKRIDEMIKIGLIDEVKYLFNKGYDIHNQSMQSIGYKEILGYLKGEYNIDQAITKLRENTCKYAKRQRTWFRKYLKDSENNPKKNVKYIFYNLS